MKKTLCMLLCIGMAAAMCACSPGEKKAGDAPKKTEGESKGLIGITTSMYTNEGLTIMCDTIKEKVEEEGYQAVIKDANLDQASRQRM